jgi:hypothetical protein
MRRILIILLACSQTSWSAIAFDNASNPGFSGSNPNTMSFTTGSGSNRIMVCGFESNGGDDITAFTYNSVALTQINKQADSSGGMSFIYYLLNPASGSNTVSVTRSGSGNSNLACVTYTGAAQSGQPDANAASGPNSHSVSVTTANDNDWIVVFGASRSDSNLTPSTGILNNYTGAGQFSFLGDTGAISPAAATTVAYSAGCGANCTINAASISPAGGAAAAAPGLGKMRKLEAADQL